MASSPTLTAGRAAPAIPISLPADHIEPRRLFAFLCMVFGMFMAILDIQIVSASLTEIQAGLAASSNEITWVQTSYLIADVVMVPLSGMMSRLLSTRVLFVTATLGFTGASVLCATASSLGQMIVYRAMQGFCGGAMTRVVGSENHVRPCRNERRRAPITRGNRCEQCCRGTRRFVQIVAHLHLRERRLSRRKEGPDLVRRNEQQARRAGDIRVALLHGPGRIRRRNVVDGREPLFIGSGDVDVGKVTYARQQLSPHVPDAAFRVVFAAVAVRGLCDIDVPVRTGVALDQPRRQDGFPGIAKGERDGAPDCAVAGEIGCDGRGNGPDRHRPSRIPPESDQDARGYTRGRPKDGDAIRLGQQK
jgi:hypothetical protein